MNRPRPTLVLLVLLLPVLAASGHAAPVTHPDRESTYPEGVANITHAPWDPRPGEDVTVTLTLTSDAQVPARVDLLYCRVEPNYVCTAVPPRMDPDEAQRVWTTTIPWDDRFMTAETRHVGYNLTMRYADPSAETGVRRVAAPLGNHWVPETFPEDSDGRYYFLAYEGPSVERDSPAPGLALFLLAALVAAVRSRRMRRGAGHV